MRLQKDQINFLKKCISKIATDVEIFLFGSRTNEQLKGGDIDILVVGKDKLSLQDIRNIKIAFYLQFGEQKIDIISFKKDDPASFKQLALLEAKRL